ncbi:fibronectin type III domain-containing protein [Devosia sp. MC1541]|uniref:fibronectin type III domain-containing protein n=1 Tax=Devosia sp. MC1541 TaxID=2725264 RepID=UPI00145F97E6|nr:fibronectin type III domain-containing protein [Devosia sp. MC1541]
MLLRLFRAALLGGTMLFAVPTLAMADPISVGILGAMGFSGAAGLMAPTAVLMSLVGNAIMAALPGFLLNLAIGVGLTMLVSALTPQKHVQMQDPGARIVNLRQSIQDRSKSYGLVRAGGPVAFWKAKGGKRYVVVLLNTGRIDGVQEYHLDETVVTLDDNGYVQQDQFNVIGWGRQPMVRIGSFLGAPGQTAHPYITSAFSEWTANHKLQGIAGLVGVFQNPAPEQFQKIYPNGREPTLNAVFRGTRVYDPRDPTQTLSNPATYKYSTNAALVIADWIVSPDGYGQQVDWAEVAEEADIADSLIRRRDGSWIKKWQLCGTYYFGQTREEVRKQLAAACDAWFYDRPDGKVGFKVGRWMEPRVTLRAEHINSIKLGEGQDGENQTNAMTIEYVEPSAGFRQTLSAAVSIADGEETVLGSAAVHWIPNHTQACAVAKRTLHASRAPYDITLNTKLYGLLLMPSNKDDATRIFAVDAPEFGISGNFEMSDWEFAPDGMSINITGKSTKQSDWPFDGLTDEPEPTAFNDIGGSETVADPTNVTLASPAAGALHVTFDPPSRPSLLQKVRYKAVSSSDWNEVTVPSSQTYLTINGLPPGTPYQAQVQFRTATQVSSNWVASTPSSINIASTSTPPGPVTSPSVTGGAGQATFSWTAPNSPNYVGAQIFINTTNTFPTGTPAATEYGLPNAADSRVVSGLSAGTKYGWIVAINSNGDRADPVATGSFTVT